MHLTSEGWTLTILQMAPSYLIVESQHELPPAEGQVTLRVDGHSTSWRVCLPEGVRRGVTRVPVANAAGSPSMASPC